MALLKPSPPGGGTQTIGDVFSQKGLWRWWEQNSGRGTNPFNGVTEKGIDYSNTFGTPIAVPVGGKIMRIVHNNNSIGDVVELEASDGSVWLYQHITAKVKVNQTLGVGGIVGTENGLPVDQYSTGPHIEVRYCKPHTWNPTLDSWNEPWVNPFLIFGNLSNDTANGKIDSGGIPNILPSTLNALAPNANVAGFLYSVDQFMQVKNPFDTGAQGGSDSIPIISGISGASFPDPIKWLGVVGTNFFQDAGAIAWRVTLGVIAVFILYKVFSKFVDLGAVTGTAIKLGESVAMLGAL